MKPLSTLAEAVHASSTMAIDSMYKNMKAQGIDVVGFGAGEPDFPPRIISKRPASVRWQRIRPSILPLRVSLS